MKTVIIGIPAYNEEENIGFLIRDLLNQKEIGFKLSKIIVSSDGSTDRTTKIVRSLKKRNVFLINNPKRAGRAIRQNQITKFASSDIFVLLDADILIKDKLFIKKLINPILKDSVDLTAARIKELNTQNPIEKSLHLSMDLKEFIFSKIKNGDNVYTCHGPARAFSDRLYRKIKYPISVGEDAYSFLFAKYNNFNYQYTPNAVVYYKLPTNFSDHKKQSLRFIESKKLFIRKFGKEFIKNEYSIPQNLIVYSTILFFFKNPLYFVSYLFILAGVYLINIVSSKDKNGWEVAKSSKNLRKAAHYA